VESRIINKSVTNLLEQQKTKEKEAETLKTFALAEAQ